MDLRVTTLEPRLSAASYPPLRQAQGRLLHKTQGRGTHYVGDVGAIKAQGHPAVAQPFSLVGINNKSGCPAMLVMSARSKVPGHSAKAHAVMMNGFFGDNESQP